ncbi:hypothetical protein ENUP19_0047G0240 [Entamoeba nuttalli]|uniref:Uncharacterized protein n=2 Tax=Entamoeba nuttalli TaxID=412467 RepID=K2H129_ENTNP|nr:hypothetical protein ENU1_064890 [Entamoeba nuttalli P19]EKE41198.1 hypothetical protein ENU1_064890 [Entamoeba nuttalli P19]|eukprot:XP_008856464.1 hypothetical protein ENU1_064890 [Entamoeba nuttalli P19]
MQFQFSSFGVFENNKNLLDAIDKNEVKDILFEYPHTFIWQENDSILFIKNDGTLQRLDQTTSTTKFVLFENKHCILIRCDSEKKLTFNLIKNDQIVGAQFKVLINVMFKENDILYSYHHPNDFVIFIGVKGNRVLYKIRYNIIFLNEDLNEVDIKDMSTFKIILEGIEEIQLKEAILQIKNIDNLLVILTSSENNKSSYCIYDMKLATLQFIPFYHTTQIVHILKRDQDLVMIEDCGDIFVMNSNFALPIPIKISSHYLLPKGIPFITFLRNDIIITITSIKIECFSLSTERIIYENNEIPQLDITECIAFNNKTTYGIYQSECHQFYEIIPKSNKFVAPFSFKTLIETTKKGLTQAINRLNSLPKISIQNKVDNYQDTSIFIYLPRNYNFVNQCIDRMKKEQTVYSFTSQVLLSSINALINSIKVEEESEPLYENIPYINFKPILISSKANEDLHNGLFEEFGNCVRSQFKQSAFELLLFIQELQKNGFNREEIMKIISAMYSTIQCVGTYESFKQEQLHIIVVIQFILFGIDNVLKAINDKQGIYSFYSVDYERLLNVADIIGEKHVFGYDNIWKRKTYQTVLIHLLSQNNKELIIKLLNRIEDKNELIEEIMIDVVLNKIDTVDISFLMKLLSSN